MATATYNPRVNFGTVYGDPKTPSYITDKGVPVWMWRKGQKVRFFTADGEQIGPEQSNVAPAIAAAAAAGWRDPGLPEWFNRGFTEQVRSGSKAVRGNPATAYKTKAIGSRVMVIRVDPDGQEQVVFTGSARSAASEAARLRDGKQNPRFLPKSLFDSYTVRSVGGEVSAGPIQTMSGAERKLDALVKQYPCVGFEILSDKFGKAVKTYKPAMGKAPKVDRDNSREYKSQATEAAKENTKFRLYVDGREYADYDTKKEAERAGKSEGGRVRVKEVRENSGMKNPSDAPTAEAAFLAGRKWMLSQLKSTSSKHGATNWTNSFYTWLKKFSKGDYFAVHSYKSYGSPKYAIAEQMFNAFYEGVESMAEESRRRALISVDERKPLSAGKVKNPSWSFMGLLNTPPAPIVSEYTDDGDIFAKSYTPQYYEVYVRSNVTVEDKGGTRGYYVSDKSPHAVRLELEKKMSYNADWDVKVTQYKSVSTDELVKRQFGERRAKNPTLTDVLASVKRGERELTIDVRDWPRSKVDELETLANLKGLHVSGDGKHVLIRPQPRETRNPSAGSKPTVRQLPDGLWEVMILRFYPDGQAKRLGTGLGTRAQANTFRKCYLAGDPVGACYQAARAQRNPRKRNGATSDAEELYEQFHGRAATGSIDYVETLSLPETFVELGDLVDMTVLGTHVKSAVLTAPDPDSRNLNKIVKLATSSNGKQIYFIGGDQSLDLAALGFEDSQIKHNMMIGVLKIVTYRTQKGFDKFKTIDYYHELGEETGNPPYLTYDPVNKLMHVVGGNYCIKPEGITD